MRRSDGCPSSSWLVWGTLHKDASGKVLKVCYTCNYWSCDLHLGASVRLQFCVVFRTSKLRSVNKILFSLLIPFLFPFSLPPFSSLLASSFPSSLFHPFPKFLPCLLPPFSSLPECRVSDRLLSDGSSRTGRLLSHDLCHYPRPCSTCI